MTDSEAELIAEQLRNAINLLRAEINLLKAEVQHQGEFNRHRLAQLEEISKDHETRIRTATDGVTQFKVWSGLATGGSWLVSAIALIRTWFGG